MQPLDLLLRNATLPDGSTAEIGISGGRIAAIGPGAGDTAAETVDLAGALVLPGLVDGHVHLDTTLFGDIWRPHRPCTAGFDVRERLAIQSEAMAVAAPVEVRAAALIERMVSRGTTSLRTHVEIDPDTGLKHLEAILAVRERYAHAIDIEIVALPRGILVRPGTLALFEQALQSGAQVAGGLDPAGFEGDVARHLDTLFALAERYGVGIDLHLHDGGDLGLFELQEIARRTRAHSMEGRVVVSHAYALGELPWERVVRTAGLLAGAGVSIMTNAPGDHPFPPVLELRNAGVNVFAGNDDIRDTWWPYGDGDMLERAMLIAYRSGFLTDDELQVAFDLATACAARALGLADHGLAVGFPADLVVVQARHVPKAIVSRPARDRVYKGGRLVAADGGFLAPFRQIETAGANS